jgi:hypothetical protein
MCLVPRKEDHHAIDELDKCLIVRHNEKIDLEPVQNERESHQQIALLHPSKSKLIDCTRWTLKKQKPHHQLDKYCPVLEPNFPKYSSVPKGGIAQLRAIAATVPREMTLCVRCTRMPNTLRESVEMIGTSATRKKKSPRGRASRPKYCCPREPTRRLSILE